MPTVQHSPEIRVASEDSELLAIYRFRYAIYVEEMNRPQSYADHAHRLIRDGLDDHSCNIAAWRGDRVVGVVRVTFAADGDLGNYEALYDMRRVGTDHPARTSIVTRLMIAPECRGTSLAVRLSVACMEMALERGVRWNFLDCNDHLVGFFEGMGASPYIGRVEHPEYGRVTPMITDIQDLGHLERLRSPLAAPLRAWQARRALAGA